MSWDHHILGERVREIEMRLGCAKAVVVSADHHRAEIMVSVDCKQGPTASAIVHEYQATDVGPGPLLPV